MGGREGGEQADSGHCPTNAGSKPQDWVRRPLPAPGATPFPHIPERRDGSSSGKVQRSSTSLTSSTRGSKSLKGEVSYGQEALLTRSSGVLSCPPRSSMQSPHPRAIGNFSIFQSPALHQPSSLSPSQTASSLFNLTRFLPPTQGIPQTLPSPPLPDDQNKNIIACHTRWSSFLHRFLPTFSPGRVGAGRDSLLPDQAHPHSPGVAARSLTHWRTQSLGGDPQQREGSATG